MKRLIGQYLSDWRHDKYRKPLVIRGARQVGKTHVVKELAQSFDHFIEINFELEPKFKNIFDHDLSAKRISRDIGLIFEKKIIPGKTLLFLDEIQAAPRALSALRYFYEEMPDLHVIAAGSLLDFALKHLGIPVGRVDFIHMYPLSFIEFLQALGHELLIDEIKTHEVTQPINEIVHKKILDLLGIYMAVGGMPEAVKRWIETNDFQLCSKVHHLLINGYKQDFQKYAQQYQIKYLDLLFDRIPMQLGRQFKYSNISKNFRKRELEPCLDMLRKAGIVNIVTHSNGNGLPLGAEVNPNKFKMIFLDVALMQAILGLNGKDWILDRGTAFVNKGVMAEAFIGQEILAYSEPHIKPSLYYWHRESRGSSAEIDYLMQLGADIVPIEVKSNKGSYLKSLNMFLKNKPNSHYGVRFSTHNYSEFDSIHSYPLYAVHRMMNKSRGLE